jgi:DNA-binding transcriptional ArsR family regulator
MAGANGLAPSDAAFAFAHPVRAQVALALAAAEGPLSPSALAADLGERLGTVSYHVKIMLGLGVLEEAGTRPVRGALEHLYINVVDDRRGRLDFQRAYRLGGQGEGKPLRVTQLDPDEIGPVGAARRALVEYFIDHEGEQLTQTRLEEAISGKAGYIRDALRHVVANVPDIYRDQHPKREDWFVYVYDPERRKAETAGGLSL